MHSPVANQHPNYDGFKQSIHAAADIFNQIPKKECVRVVSHLDADGICSASILINALMKQSRRYALTVLPTITEEALQQLNEESERYIVFVDLGSGSVDLVGSILPQKTIFILDHHMLQSPTNYPHIIQVNPHLYDIEGSNEIPGSGVVFLFTQALTNNNNTEMARIAVVGAIGDVQEDHGFKSLNNEILELAKQRNLVEVRRGLRFFGVQTKPLYKILQYSSDILIPGVSGSESGAIQFLSSIGVDPKNSRGWRKIADLTEDEKKKLIAGIIMKRAEEKNPSDIFTNAYLLVGEIEDSPFRDAKEFATLLNSCGRMGKASIGIGACLNDKRMKDLAVQNLNEYRKEIVNALNWYRDNQNTSRIMKRKNCLIINAEEEVLPTMIGTLGSILSKSPDVERDIFILSLARNYDQTTKISLRVSGNPEHVNLKDVINAIIQKINHGTSGGHIFAAGAVIATEFEDAFIAAATDILGGVTIAGPVPLSTTSK